MESVCFDGVLWGWFFGLPIILRVSQVRAQWDDAVAGQIKGGGGVKLY